MTTARDLLEKSGRELLLLLETAVHNGEHLELVLDKAFEAGRRLGRCEGIDRAQQIWKEVSQPTTPRTT